MKPQPVSKAWLSRLKKLDTRKGREEENRFLAEGWKIVRECFEARLPCEALVVSESLIGSEEWNDLGSNYGVSGIQVFTLPESDFKKAASTRSPQGIVGVFDCPKPPTLEALRTIEGIMVVLDGVQDPGNVGTAIRCAAGLGAEAVALTQGCADVWNPKTIRASAGSLFRLPVVTSVDSGVLGNALVEWGFEVWIADAEGAPLRSVAKRPDRLALVFGNESRGAGSAWKTLPGSKKVGLPLERGVESLNVGAAVAAMLAALAWPGDSRAHNSKVAVAKPAPQDYPFLMKVQELIWTEDRVLHLAGHGVRPHEVEEVCFGDPLVLRAKSEGENPVYHVLGQTEAGSYLFCVVIRFPDGRGYPVTARPMTEKERRRFNNRKPA